MYKIENGCLFKNDMSVSVRLQGYVINLHGYKNVLMIYNEPHYPTDGVFDYHPLAIQTYRKYGTKNSSNFIITAIRLLSSFIQKTGYHYDILFSYFYL